jgi:tetratricopeptide (TPR) repeat protein
VDQNAEFYFRQAEEKFGANDIAVGFADLDEAILLDSSNPDYYFLRGLKRFQNAGSKVSASQNIPIDAIISRQNSQLELALSDFTRTLELNSDFKQQVEVYQKRAFCYFALGRTIAS